MRGAARIFPAAVCGFVVFLLSVSVIQGQDEQHSPPVYPPKSPSVSVSPSGDINENSLVILICNSDANPAATYTWYELRANPQPLSDERRLVFTSIKSSDKGLYYCVAENKVGSARSKSISINVKYAPKRPRVSVSPSGDIKEGCKVTLTCSSDANPAAKYTWYKSNGNVKPPSNEPQLVFSSITSSDSGHYYCAAENRLGTKASEYSYIDVKYAPKYVIVSVSPSGEIRENSRVTLSCSSDANPAATYTWYKNGQAVSENVFTSIKSSDAGNYYCKAVNKVGAARSKSISINVKYPPKSVTVFVRPFGEIRENSSVTLTCSSDANPPATYAWYKAYAHRQPCSEEQQLVFSSIQSSDSGWYYCAAKNKLQTSTSQYFHVDVKYAPRRPSVSVSPSADIKEGGSVTLTCSSDANPAAKYTWYKKNRNPSLQPDNKKSQQAKSFKSQLEFFIRAIQSSESGEYYCVIENKLGRRTSESIFIGLKYAPKRPSVSVFPSGEIEEGSSVNLTCSSDANPAANYTWYKENQTLVQGREGSYHFTSISSEDSGSYTCKSENQYGWIDSTSVVLDVLYAPKRPSVSVSPSEIEEGSSVNLTCSSDANPAANYTWYKENEDSPKASGQIFTITDFRAEHSGNYYCAAENNRGRRNSTLHLITVADKSSTIVTIIKLTLMVVMPISLLLFSLWMRIQNRIKKTQSSTTEPHEARETLELDPSDYENVSGNAAWTEDAEEQEELV